MHLRRMFAPHAVRLALWLVALAPGAAAAADLADSSSTSLAPTSAPPWNPARAISPNQPWEAVLRFPARLVSLPIAAIGQCGRVGMLAAEQGFAVQRIVYLFHGIPLPVSVGPAGLGDRTGTGAGLFVTPKWGPVRVGSFFDASTVGYTRTRMRIGVGAAMLEYRQDLRPNERFFGLGMNAAEAGESRYGLVQQRVVAGFDLASGVSGPGGPGERFSMWVGPRWSRTTQGFGSDEPSITRGFPAQVAGTLDREFEHLTYGARVAVDHRGGRPHWGRGWRAAFEAERFDRPFTASPSRTGAQFTRYTLLAEGAVSFRRDPRTLRLTFEAVDNEAGRGFERFFVSDLARSGGSNGLPGYEPHRFHDLDAMNVRLAYVYPLAQHFEAEVHGDAGGVFTDLQHDARPNLLRQSAGFTIRGRTAASVVTSLGFDFSPEAARFVFSLGGEP